MRYISFVPIYQERVWGGQALKDTLGRHLPSTKSYGESWEIVDRPEAQSVIASGRLKGKTLREAISTDYHYIMGPNGCADKPFPILVKWLDCKQRLSLQVHPPAAIAAKLNGEPKTENWYIINAEPDASLLVGLKKGVSQEEFEHALKNDALEPLVHRIPSKVGYSMLVPSGRIHAIDAGNLILEIQQNSDTTYRVYDWGRLGLDGKPRQLHIEQSLASINFEDFEPEGIDPKEIYQELVNCPEFKLVKHLLKPGEVLEYGADKEPRLLGVVEGALEEAQGGTLSKGDNVLLPYAESFAFKASEISVVLETCGFVKDAS